MMTSTTKKLVAAGLAAATIAGGLFAGSAAHADPQQLNPTLAGVGSDTTQAVMNALTGFNNGINYTPINAGSAYSYKQIVSFDATVPAGKTNSCMTTKLNGPAFTRPQGSGAGQLALYNASGVTKTVTSGSDGQGYTGTFNGNAWTGKTGTQGYAICVADADLSGSVDFARSSSISSVTSGTDLTYIPFARDAISFATYRPGDTANTVTSLTRKNLIDIFSSSTRQVIGGVTWIPCGMNTLSGTKKDWQKMLNSTSDTNENTATSECNLAGTGSRIEENTGPQLSAKGDALFATGTYAANANFQVIAGFAASSYIARFNGVDSPAPGTNVKLGSITNTSTDGTGSSDIGSPFTGTTTLTPSATFFNNSTFGRLVYNVLPTDLVAVSGDGATKALFVGETSKVCSESATIATFGFLTIGSTCGATSSTYQRGWTVGKGV